MPTRRQIGASMQPNPEITMNLNALHLQQSFAAAVLLAITAAAPALAAEAPAGAPADWRFAITAPARDASAAAHASQVLAAIGIRRDYALDNGQLLTIEPRLSHLRVRYGMRSPVALRADGRGNFVSGDGQLSLRLALQSSGEAGDVALTMPSAWQ